MKIYKFFQSQILENHRPIILLLLARFFGIAYKSVLLGRTLRVTKSSDTQTAACKAIYQPGPAICAAKQRGHNYRDLFGRGRYYAFRNVAAAI